MSDQTNTYAPREPTGSVDFYFDFEGSDGDEITVTIDAERISIGIKDEILGGTRRAVSVSLQDFQRIADEVNRARAALTYWRPKK